mmetsp:Transcript_21681/g.61739  ORF Transcript_21681/g.61739 Transcript_21681/m.61739 type:complete len:364 (-) Transcript_21681:40-1131(-)
MSTHSMTMSPHSETNASIMARPMAQPQAQRREGLAPTATKPTAPTMAATTPIEEDTELAQAIELNNHAVSLMLSPSAQPSADGSAIRCFRQSLTLLRRILLQRSPSHPSNHNSSGNSDAAEQARNDIALSATPLQRFNNYVETNFYAFGHPILIPSSGKNNADSDGDATDHMSMIPTDTIQLYCTSVMMNIALLYHRRAYQLHCVRSQRFMDAYRHAHTMYQKVLLCSQPPSAPSPSAPSASSTIVLHAMTINNMAFLYRLTQPKRCSDALRVLDRILFDHPLPSLDDEILRELHLNILFFTQRRRASPAATSASTSTTSSVMDENGVATNVNNDMASNDCDESNDDGPPTALLSTDFTAAAA